MNYLIHRSPDFFDWRSGVFELPTTPEVVEESSRLLLEGDYEQYLKFSSEQKIEKILQFQELLTEKHQTQESRANLLFKLGNLLVAANEFEGAIASYNEAVKIKDELNLYELKVKLKILDLLHTQLKSALTQAIKQEIQYRISSLEKSKKYAPFAQKFIPGLQLYYSQGLSLKEIAPKLAMTSWNQARRVLNPGDLLIKIRLLTVQQLLNSILKKAEENGLTKIPPEIDYLKALAEYIEAFADDEIFREAAQGISAGKSRSMNSVYAQQMLHYLEQHCG